MKSVELANGYVWDCDDCGRENYCRAVTVEYSPDDRKRMAEQYGTPEHEWMTGMWISRPNEVTCKFCGEKFEVHEDSPDGKEDS